MRPLLLLPALALALAAGSAAAADNSALAARIDGAGAREQALEARLARDMAVLDGPKVAALFGESDEEKAAREQHEQNQDQGIATLNQRVGDLESSLTRLTGQVEQLDHRIQELNQRLDRMKKDFDYKLCTLSAQQLGAQEGGDSGLPCGEGGGPGTPQGGNSITGAVQPTPAPGAPADAGNGVVNAAPQAFAGDRDASAPPQHLAPGPSTLGTLPSNTPLPLPPPPGQGDMPAPVPVTKPEFDKAMNMLARAQYDQALAAFQAFVDKHPDDTLAPQALYWIGDIYFVQKDYVNASRSLALGIKKYPTSERAPASLLKLAETMIAMDRKKDGCTALAALPSRYPKADKAVTAKAASERKAVCGR
ncbi:MAG TPA: tol-pal system protein YbgF [Rhizomicrobium sp.]|nr:tol-pal system protein YbgF [Rhizomicrobium sp.]